MVANAVMLAKKPLTAHDIRDQTGVNIKAVYVSLHHLKHKGAVRGVLNGEKMYYEARDKAMLLECIKHVLHPYKPQPQHKPDFGPLLNVMGKMLPC